MSKAEKHHPPSEYPATLEEMVSTLEATGNYKVLRRLPMRQPAPAPAEDLSKLGIILDLETTGLDPDRDEIIEIAMIKFSYSKADDLRCVVDRFQSFNEPRSPIPARIVELTGITDAMLEGRKINPSMVDAFVADAQVVIAHNASFDRPFAERLRPIFVQKSWACSLTEIDWRSHGFDGSKLNYLLAGHGFFHDAHRAIDDCHALLEILARPPATGSGTMLAALLAHARRKTFRVFAENSPYELKDALKARGYRWSDGSNGSRRSWYLDVDEELREVESRFLKQEIYQRDVDIQFMELTALDRFSRRTR